MRQAQSAFNLLNERRTNIGHTLIEEKLYSLVQGNIPGINNFLVELNFMVNNAQNTCQRTVLTSRFISAYRGQIVIRWSPNNRGGSFDEIMLLPYDRHKDDNEGRRTLSHEHGHFQQRQMLTAMQYYIGIGIPSMRSGNMRDRSLYFTRPWEVIADVLGRVTGRDNPPTQRDIALGWAYMKFLQSKSDAEMIQFGWSWARVFDIDNPDFSFLDNWL